MSNKPILLRPGFMIALHAIMKGGVEHDTINLTEPAVVDTGALIEKWQTTKTTVDVAEYEQAVKVRGLAVYAIRKHCVKSPFGLLCSEDKEAELDLGVVEAHKLKDEFNATSVYSKISLYTLKGRILTSDEKASAAIAAEMRSLMADMGAAIQKMDPEAIGEAVKRAKEMNEMLADDQQGKVSVAIDLARKAKREITKTIKAAGGQAITVVLDYREQLLAIESAKSAFLSFEEVIPLAAEDEAPAVQAQDLDLSEIPNFDQLEIKRIMTPEPDSLSEALEMESQAKREDRVATETPEFSLDLQS